jgi:hypothetical protein
MTDIDDTNDNGAPVLPPKDPAAVSLGRRGGSSRSPRKIEAARRNMEALRRAGKGGWTKGKPRKPRPPDPNGP